MKYLFVIVYLFVQVSLGIAQEVVTNPALNKKLKTANAQLRVTNLDTLGLPFVDDFSNSSYNQTLQNGRIECVCKSRFSDSSCYARVATFDGLNAQGRAYDNSSSTAYGKADELTSQAINLAGRFLIRFI